MGSCLVDLFDLDGISDPKVEFEESNVFINARLQTNRYPCLKCGSDRVKFKAKRFREFRLPPVGSKKVTLKLLVKKLQCCCCLYNWWPQVPLSKGKERMTESFVNHVLDLLRMGTIKDVAEHLGVSWDTVKDIHKERLQREYQEILIDDVKYVSVDEFSIRKGHNYMTVFTDVVTGRVIHAVEGRKKEDIKPFLEILKKRGVHLER